MCSSDLDPITGTMVAIEVGGPSSRQDFEMGPVATGDASEACPLCEGHEHEAGSEILAWRDGTAANGPGWQVRVVANRHPLLRIEQGLDVRREGVFESREGLGAHEVVVESPRHDQPLHMLDTDHLWRVFWAWRSRLQDLKRDRRFVSAVVFKNHGKAAGARLDHPHSQIMACSAIPPAVARELHGATQHWSATGRCVFCDVLRQERQDGRRLIADHGAAVAIAPYASRVPFETWILPTEHGARFEDASDTSLHALAAAFKMVMSGIDWALERPASNVVLHTAPFSGNEDAAFHWHLEILPRVTRYGGVEWATGMHRNPVSPEAAAAALRR